MDRTMYGKIDPGARHPYRCTVREKGILPGCKFTQESFWILFAYLQLNQYCTDGFVY